MTAEIIAAFGETFRRDRRVRKEASASAAAMALSGGSATLPLGVKDLAVAIPPAEGVRRVSATALCRDSSGVITVRLRFKSGKPQSVLVPAGEEVRDTDEMSTSFLVRLVAGEPKDFLEIEPHAEATEVALSRVGGEPCLLRLHVHGEADAATEDGGTGAREPTAPARQRTSVKGTIWKAQELLREGYAERALDVALTRATDIERPAVALLRATLAEDDAEWLAHVNAYVEPFAIAPIRLEGTSGPRFLRLAADAPETISGGPLVTVIMPAFNAEATLAHAAGSILKQSWAELELIIVDDCSTDTTYEIGHHIARNDPRARVLRNRVNVGPYVSKNMALSMARGEYITCHDADDWAHPQRLENQVDALLAADGRACVASWLRLDQAGAFGGFTSIGRQSHDGALRIAHVTCMIEAEFMRRYVGHWDCVRFGADGEMLERLEGLLGQDLLRPRQLSVFSLDTPRSLTNDTVHGISRTAGLSATRREYRDAWRRWHATLTSAGAYINFPLSQRPFVAPDDCVVSSETMRVVSAMSPIARGFTST